MEHLRAPDTANAANAAPTGPPCAVCRKPLAPDAGKCTECGSCQGEPCVVCAQRLPRAGDGEPVPRKCTACGSFQSRPRRLMALSSGTLALLTALLAVAGLVLPPLHSFLVPASVSYLDTTEDGHLLVVVTNRTEADVYLERAELSGKLLSEGPHALAPVDDDGSFVDRDRTPFPPGSTPLRLRPVHALALGEVPGAETPFTLHLGMKPSRFWSPKREEVSGVQEFVCTWEKPEICSGRRSEEPTEGAGP